MRLLILTFSYAPRPNPRAIRWTALAEEFARHGNDVAVITGWQPGELSEETLNGVRIFRVGSHFVEPLRQYLAKGRSRGAQTTAHASTLDKSAGIAARVLGWVNRALWSKLWWPDSTCVWYGPAVRKARELLRSAPFNTVISVSPTFTAVLAGYRTFTNAPASCNWILDLGDPFSFMEQAPPNNFRLYCKLNRWFERRAFNRAGAISVTNEATRVLYAQLYPESASKITVIPPLLATQPLPDPPENYAPHLRDKCIRLVFVGTLYGGIRRPDFLLQLFERADIPGAELHFFGNIHECRDSIAKYSVRNKNIVVHGTVSREAALQAIKNADVLVNLGNDTPFQLPSKLVEYAATGKRIISISRLASDSSIAFLEEYPNTLCISDQGRAPTADQIREFVSFCENQNRGTVDEDVLKAFMRPFTLPVIAAHYNALFTTQAVAVSHRYDES